MKKNALRGLALSLVTLAAIPAYAGSKVSYRVNVTTAWAEGTLSAVRAAPDSMQQIECQVTAFPGYAPGGYCFARDAAGTTRSCWTSDPGMIATIESIQGDSYVFFQFNTTSTCTALTVRQSSANEPKAQ
ncbi:MAG TPA: hypothetical protein VL463_10050 [Kofleriaceae bacterium]|nr:hypothetical protein [Kofleriaceae bacterium]